MDNSYKAEALGAFALCGPDVTPEGLRDLLSRLEAPPIANGGGDPTAQDVGNFLKDLQSSGAVQGGARKRHFSSDFLNNALAPLHASGRLDHVYNGVRAWAQTLPSATAARATKHLRLRYGVFAQDTNLVTDAIREISDEQGHGPEQAAAVIERLTAAIGSEPAPWMLRLLPQSTAVDLATGITVEALEQITPVSQAHLAYFQELFADTLKTGTETAQGATGRRALAEILCLQGDAEAARSVLPSEATDPWDLALHAFAHLVERDMEAARQVATRALNAGSDKDAPGVPGFSGLLSVMLLAARGQISQRRQIFRLVEQLQSTKEGWSQRAYHHGHAMAAAGRYAGGESFEKENVDSVDIACGHYADAFTTLALRRWSGGDPPKTQLEDLERRIFSKLEDASWRFLLKECKDLFFERVGGLPARVVARWAKPQAPWQRTLEMMALHAGLGEADGAEQLVESDTRLAWSLIRASDRIGPSPRLQKRRGGSWTRGQKVPLLSLHTAEVQAQPWFTPQDEGMLAFLPTTRRAPTRGSRAKGGADAALETASLKALIGHPYCFWEDTPKNWCPSKLVARDCAST